MATTGVRELGVKITGDASDFESTMKSASTATQAFAASLEDAAGTDISPQLQLSRLNRDIANLNRVLDGIERRKADPDIGADLTKLLADEKRVRAMLAKLEAESATIEIDGDATGVAAAHGGMLRCAGGLDKAKEGAANLGAQLPVIGRLLAGLGRAGPAGAAAAAVLAIGAAAAIAAVKLGLMAAAVEQTKIQLTILAGSEELGAKLFGELQTYAAETPFFFDEITNSARRLLAAGVTLKEIPGYLEDIGNIAAVTGVPLEQIATVFGQMESKGKATYEELQQLAEAGIPVWSQLAEAMGLTVAETQKMATEGKLTIDAVRGVRDILGNTYGGATQQMAETFTGKMSTLKDSLTQLGQSLGEYVLPLMKDFGTIAIWLVEQLAGVIEAVIAWLKENEEIAEVITTLVFGPLKALADVTSKIAGNIEEDAAETSSFDEAMKEAGVSTEGWVADLEVLNESLIAVIDTQLAARQASRNLSKVMKEQGAVTLKTKQALNEAASAHVAHAEAMIEDGRSAQAVRKYLRGAAADIRESAKEANLSKQEVEKYLKRLDFTPKKVETKLEVDKSDAEKQLDAVKKELAFLEEQNVSIPVDVVVNVTGDVDAARQLGVGVNGTSVGSLGLGVSPMAAGAMSSSVTGASTGSTVNVNVPTKTILAPKPQPLKVYLDGAEIASRVSGRYSPTPPRRSLTTRRP